MSDMRMFVSSPACESVLQAIETYGHQQTEVELCRWLADCWATKVSLDKPQVEATLFDRSRVDLLTSTTAFEVDCAEKWKEAIGQALYYALLTKRRPAVLLLITNRNKELTHLMRCQLVCSSHDIELWFYFVEDAILSHDSVTYHLND